MEKDYRSGNNNSITSERINADAKSGFIGVKDFTVIELHTRGNVFRQQQGSVHVYMIEQRRQPGDGILGICEPAFVYG